jgi:hypothetical protein
MLPGTADAGALALPGVSITRIVEYLSGWFTWRNNLASLSVESCDDFSRAGSVKSGDFR